VPTPVGRINYLAFNSSRSLFADVRTRRAVQYALDRVALAEADPTTAVPATRVLSTRIPGFDPRPAYPLRGDQASARKLASGLHARAIVYTWDDHPYTDAFNDALRRQLGAVGVHMTILPMSNEDYDQNRVAEKAARADLYWGGASAETSDPVSYLRQLFLPPHEREELDRIAKLSSPVRDLRAVALARRIEKESLFAVYDAQELPTLVSKRLGCIVRQPEYPGVDLAALCIRH
jgi:ABC-type oligopeptide transport system substrate-binding subunit